MELCSYSGIAQLKTSPCSCSCGEGSVPDAFRKHGRVSLWCHVMMPVLLAHNRWK